MASDHQVRAALSSRLRSLVYLDAAHDRRICGRGAGGRRMSPPRPKTRHRWVRSVPISRESTHLVAEAEVHAFYRFSPDGRVLGRSPAGASGVNAEIAKVRNTRTTRTSALRRWRSMLRNRVQSRPFRRTTCSTPRPCAGRTQHRLLISVGTRADRGLPTRHPDGRVVEISGANHFVFVLTGTMVLRVMREFFGATGDE